jgi:hypothetical protein
MVETAKLGASASAFFSRVGVGLHVFALRLRLATKLGGSSIPSLMDSLSRAAFPMQPTSIDEFSEALFAAERVITSLRIVPDTCLYKSLARYSVLRRAGHSARFVMGVYPGEELRGHAWVEVDGEPFDETVDPELAVTFTYPPTVKKPEQRPGSQAAPMSLELEPQ